MITWKKYGAIHVGTTDIGVQFEVTRRSGNRYYSLSQRHVSGGDREWCHGYQSVRAAKVAATVEVWAKQIRSDSEVT